MQGNQNNDFEDNELQGYIQLYLLVQFCLLLFAVILFYLLLISIFQASNCIERCHINKDLLPKLLTYRSNRNLKGGI